MKKTFHICSVACLRMRTDEQKIFNYLKANGYKYTNNYSKADFIFIDTCAYCKKSEADSVHSIKKCFEYKKLSAKIIVIGCLAKNNPDLLKKLGVECLVPALEMDKLDELMDSKIKLEAIEQPTKVMDFLSAFEDNNYTADARQLYKNKARKDLIRRIFRKHSRNNFVRNGDPTNPLKYGKLGDDVYHVRVSTGCLGNCSYCVIKNIWGKMKSRPLKDIISDFENAVSAGAKSINLEAQDLGAYGLDIGSNVIELLNGIFAVEGDYGVDIQDLNPNWLIHYYDEMKPILVKNADRINYINLPIQSGSNKILRMMHRPYKIEEVIRVVDDLLSEAPSLYFFSDVMPGFPGETEEEFEKTKQFVIDSIKKNSIKFWFTPYSDMPNTESFEMKNKIDPQTVRRRWIALKRITEKSKSRVSN